MADGDLAIERGIKFGMIWELFDDDAKTTRTAWTGYHALLQARLRRDDSLVAMPLLHLSTNDGSGKLVIEDATEAPTGKWLRIALSATDTAAIQRRGFYDLVRVADADATDVELLCSAELLLVGQLVVT